MSDWKRVSAPLMACALVGALAACGGGSGPTPPTPTPTPSPRAAVTTAGNGFLIIHPSMDPTFGWALEAPVRIQETAGGTADWNFARMSLFLNGVEIERAEIGSDTIRAAGYSRIAPRSNETYSLVFRQNSEDFDDIQMTLGFADVTYGGQFTSDVSGDTFDDVLADFTPLFAPREGAITLAQR